MKFEIDPFDNYFASAMESEKELLDSNSDLVEALRTYHEFIVKCVFAEQESLSPIQCLLALHAFMIYLASIRVTFSGHAAATFPLFRTSLEASCYAFLIGETPDLQQIWMERNRTGDALKLCRREFTSAVKDTAEKIQTKSWVSESTEDWIKQAYDAAIDFGAHPNPRGIWPYVQFKENRPDGYVAVSLASIYGPKAPETSRCLIACLDYGLLLAVILVSCLEMPSEETVFGLTGLNQIKEKLTKAYFP